MECPRGPLVNWPGDIRGLMKEQIKETFRTGLEQHFDAEKVRKGWKVRQICHGTHCCIPWEKWENVDFIHTKKPEAVPGELTRCRKGADPDLAYGADVAYHTHPHRRRPGMSNADVNVHWDKLRGTSCIGSTGEDREPSPDEPAPDVPRVYDTPTIACWRKPEHRASGEDHLPDCIVNVSPREVHPGIKLAPPAPPRLKYVPKKKPYKRKGGKGWVKKKSKRELLKGWH